MKNNDQKYDIFNFSNSVEEFKEKMLKLKSLLIPPYMDINETFIHPNKITRTEAKKCFNRELRKYRREKIKYGIIGLFSKEKAFPGHVFYGQMLSIMNLLNIDELNAKALDYAIENANYLVPEHFQPNTQNDNLVTQ